MSSAQIARANGQLLVDISDGQLSRVPVMDNEPCRATFGLFITGYVPPANPTDILFIAPPLVGTKLIRIKQIMMCGTATAASNIILRLIRRSTANSGGTSALQTAVPRDTTNDASQLSISLYSANAASLGTAVGAIDGGRLNLAPAANGSIDRFLMQYSWLNDQAFTMRAGSTEGLGINLNGAGWPAGGALDFSMSWTEE